MKNILVRISFVLAFTLATAMAADAQFVVRVRPTTRVVRIRPAAPGPRQIWRDGEWEWRGGRYQYVEGGWIMPPTNNNRWVAGNWVRRRNGWFWKPGHWSNR
ncbi:MAG: YXWGXW repeat-containing protein [Chitinophagaceae bacterium]|nr:YXWGXW repeat-containing protein [Chitinophagaceae bacterium]